MIPHVNAFTAQMVFDRLTIGVLVTFGGYFGAYAGVLARKCHCGTKLL